VPSYTRVIQPSIWTTTIAVLVCLGPALRAVASTFTPPSTAADLMNQALRNAVASGGVHEVATGTSSTTFRMINDIGPNGGRQLITFSDGATDSLIALATSNQAYQEFNARGLTDYKVTTKTAAYANKWLRETPTTSSYVTDVFATTLASDFTQFKLLGPLTLGPVQTMNGVRVRSIRGTAPAISMNPSGPATLYVTIDGTVLPFTYHAKFGTLSFRET